MASGSPATGTLSRKAARHLRKGRRHPPQTEPPEVVEEDVVNPEVYKCVVCGDENVPSSAGVATCSECFMCYGCLKKAFEGALRDITRFPAHCCGIIPLSTTSGVQRYVKPPLPFKIAEDVLDDDTLARYKEKLDEYHVPVNERVYCADPECGRFLHPRHFVQSDGFPIRKYALCPYPCEVKTCVVCKGRITDRHRCEDGTDPKIIPPEYGEYSNEWRIKRCPGCGTWLQHIEACNHMVCLCRHEFCWVCLQPCTEFCSYGCPLYGDPVEGYDEEGFENSARAIHRMDGRNREGVYVTGRDEPVEVLPPLVLQNLNNEDVADDRVFNRPDFDDIFRDNYDEGVAEMDFVDLMDWQQLESTLNAMFGV